MLEFLLSLVVNEEAQHTQGTQDIQEIQGNQHFKTSDHCFLQWSYISSNNIPADLVEYMQHTMTGVVGIIGGRRRPDHGISEHSISAPR